MNGLDSLQKSGLGSFECWCFEISWSGRARSDVAGSWDFGSSEALGLRQLSTSNLILKPGLLECRDGGDLP
jgi:hypothetical protein